MRPLVKTLICGKHLQCMVLDKILNMLTSTVASKLETKKNCYLGVCFLPNSNMDDGGEYDSWLNLTNWEKQCVDEVESTPDLEPQIQVEKDFATQKLWILFQNSATCVAQLYKDRQQNVSLWIPFQNAASSVTSLYKECLESQRRFVDLGFQCGVQRRNKEILAWAKKRKRHIRREDLISFLSDKSPPQRSSSGGSGNWNSPRQRLCLEGVVNSSHHPSHHLHHLHHHHHHHPRLAFNPLATDPSTTSGEADLQTFREALSVTVPSSPLSSSGVRQPSSPPNRGNGTRGRVPGPSAAALAELNSFIAEEYTRHMESRKRTVSSTDVIMDSPTHKRSRLT